MADLGRDRFLRRSICIVTDPWSWTIGAVIDLCHDRSVSLSDRFRFPMFVVTDLCGEPCL